MKSSGKRKRCAMPKLIKIHLNQINSDWSNWFERSYTPKNKKFNHKMSFSFPFIQRNCFWTIHCCITDLRFAMHTIRIMPGSWRNKFHTEIQNGLFYSLIGVFFFAAFIADWKANDALSASRFNYLFLMCI